MRIILAGKGERATVCLKALIEDGQNIITVVTPSLSSSQIAFDPFLSLAKENGISILSPRNINSEQSRVALNDLHPDLVVLVSYTQIIKPSLLSIPTYGFINLHGGKLPEYRGSSTLNWMIINGETEGGVSIIKVDEGIDTGPILAQERFSIAQSDTIVEVIAQANRLFPRMLSDVVKGIESRLIKGQEQDKTAGCYYHSRKPEDGRIYWNSMNDNDVHNIVRALPKDFPAFFYVDDKRIYCLSADIIDEEVRGIPGRVVWKKQNSIVVVCSNRGVMIHDVYIEGRGIVSAKEIVTTGQTLT